MTILRLPEEVLTKYTYGTLEGTLFPTGATFNVTGPIANVENETERITNSMGTPYKAMINSHNWLLANCVTVTNLQGEVMIRPVLVHNVLKHEKLTSAYLKVVRSPIGGVYTLIFDSQKRMVPGLFVSRPSEIQIVYLYYTGMGQFVDGIVHDYPYIGLWFKDGECKLPEVALHIWTNRLMSEMGWR
jgi:hypothetical protein